MPKLAEAAVLVAGQIVQVEESQDFTTKVPDGLRVLLGTGDGYASVKLKPEVAAQLKPQQGQGVAWFVRYGANGGGDRAASAYSAFVRPALENDLDRLVGLIAKK